MRGRRSPPPVADRLPALAATSPAARARRSALRARRGAGRRRQAIAALWLLLLPSAGATSAPSRSPTTSAPTQSPATSAPTRSPTSPTVSPTTSPPSVPPTTSAPSLSPSTSAPSVSPTASPTQPTRSPTTAPPTVSPTKSPTLYPTSPPTLSPVRPQLPFELDRYRDASGAPLLSVLDGMMHQTQPLRSSIQHAGPLTVFAPTNEAFNMMPDGVVDMLSLARPYTVLRPVLQFHIVKGLYLNQTQPWLPGGQSLNVSRQLVTIEGTNLTTSYNPGNRVVAVMPAYSPGVAAVTHPDRLGENGVVHGINGLLVPPSISLPRMNMTATAIARGYTVWLRAVRAGGLESLVDDTGNGTHLTCFVPTDDAFNLFTPAALSALLGSAVRSAELVRYHCIGQFMHGDALAAAAQFSQTRPTVYCPSSGCSTVRLALAGDNSLGDSILVHDSWSSTAGRHASPLVDRRGTPLCIPGGRKLPASVHIPDIFATSGVMHEVTRVLVPQGFAWPDVGQSTPPAPYPAWTLWPTPWLQCRRLPYTGCPQLLSLNNRPINTWMDTKVSVDVEAWCNGRPLGGLAKGDCAAHNLWTVTDTEEVVSSVESQIRVEVAPGSVLSLVLIDLSNSINQNAPSLEFRKQAAIKYIEAVLSADNVELTGPHYVAVYAFDGRRETQVVSTNAGANGSPWSSDAATLIALVQALECGTASSGIEYCQDPSTNLHGAVIWASQFLESAATFSGLNARNTTCGPEAFLVFFTDGLDQANYGQSANDARAELQRTGVMAFAVGHGDDATRSVMETIVGDPTAVLLASSRERIPQEFSRAARYVVEYASRTYRISWCSTRRARDHSVGVAVRVNDSATSPTAGFVVGEQVRYSGAAFGTLANSVATITEVDRYNAVGEVYRIYFAASQLHLVVAAGDINRTYTPHSLWTPTCLRSRDQNNASSDTLPGAEAVDSLEDSKLAPYSCVGGSEYTCATELCECAQGATPSGAGNCPPVASSLPPATTAVRECTGGFPASPAPFIAVNVSSDSRVSATFSAACTDGLPFGGISFSPCSGLSSLQVYESDSVGAFDKVSLYESRPRITCLSQPAHVLSLLLLDTSASVVRGSGGLPALKAAVVAYLDGLQEMVSSHMVAVYTFDGRAWPQVVIGYTSDLTAVKAAVNGLQCDGVHHCYDPASNLFGAIVYANSTLLANYTAALRTWQQTGVDPSGMAAVGTVRRLPYLVVFTDGTDTACRATEEEARLAAAWGRAVIMVGLQGEVPAFRRTYHPAGFNARGVNMRVLNNIATNGVYVADSGDLTGAFRSVGQAIATASASQYRVDYCSPKRTGVRTVRLEFTPTTGSRAGQLVSFWQANFDAGVFDCADGRCTRCLGGNFTDRLSCSDQPGPWEQSFVCTNDSSPLNVDGFCRCPCAAGEAYTTEEGPGPVKCEAPGTCFGSRPTGEDGICKRRGGLRVINQTSWGARTNGYWTAADGTRFGVSGNSRISFEFVPQCADQWSIPGLRMSSCPTLSDFSVWETDSVTGVPVQVDPWESEPRVVCHPDVVSLILLDTSGSIKQSEGGEAALREAVIHYLDQINLTATELDITHYVAIYAFDGRDTIQPIVTYGSTAAAREVMRSWQCDGTVYCVDPSTDLHGAVLEAEDIITQQQVGLSWATRRFLVLFTDGTDQAARVAENTAVTELVQSSAANGLRVFGVGLTGETADARIGLDLRALQRLAFSGVFISTSPSELVVQFGQVAARVRAAIAAEATATYRIDYCSPKRSGLRRTVIRLTLEGQQVDWYGPTFDASEFQCQTGLCSACLRHRQFTCSNQPQRAPGDRDPQFFSCGDSLDDPVPLPGADGKDVCKCPCTGTYPPDPVALPTPSPGSNSVSVPVFFCPTSACSCGSSYTSPLVVEMRTGATGGNVFYTMDGTVPTAASTQYAGAITVTAAGTVVLRAVTVREALTSESARCELTVLPPNQPPSAVVSINPVVVTIGAGTTAVNGVLTSVSGPEFGQTVTAACTAATPALFSVQPVMHIGGSVGLLSLTPAAAGASTVTCLLTDNGVPALSSSVSFAVQVVTATVAPTPGVAVCPPTRVTGRWMRVGIGLTTSQFNFGAFADAVQQAVTQQLSLPVVCLFSVCPATACPAGFCPTTTAAKTAAGCTLGAVKPPGTAERVAETQQTTQTYVDFDVTAVTDAAQQAALSDIARDVSRCGSGSACALSSQQPTLVAWVLRGATPAPTVASAGDDSVAPGWIALLAIASTFLALACIVLIYLMFCRPKKKHQQRGQTESVQRMREPGTSPPAGDSQEPWSAAQPGSPADHPLQPLYEKRAMPAAEVHSPAAPRSPTVTFADPPSVASDKKAEEYEYTYGDSYKDSQGDDGYTYTYDYEGGFEAGQKVKAMYLDGQYHEATVVSRGEDGNYTVQWYDGTFSEGIPERQLQPPAS